MDEEIIKKLFLNFHLLGRFLGYDDLSEVHNEWIKYLFFSSGDKILLAHRNSYKTSCLIVGMIAYLIFRPEDTICIIRKNETNAISLMYELQQHYKSEKIKYIYEEILKVDYVLPVMSQKSLELIYKKSVTKEQNIECFGIGGNITGQHYDLIVLDDIVTEKDRYSLAEKRKTINYIQELKNVKKTGGRIITTGTRWAEDDAIEFLIKQGIEKREYPVGSVPIKGFTESKITELKQSMTLSLYAANYELKHIKDDSQIIQNVRYFSENDQPLQRLIREGKVYMHIDTAYGGNDYTAASVVAVINDMYYVIGNVYQKHTLDCMGEIIKMIESYNVFRLYIENNADKGMMEREFRRRLEKYKIQIVGYTENQNKIKKITTTIKKYEGKLYFRYNIQTEYLKQIVDYTEYSKHDDAPDSLASLLQKINSHNKNISFIENKGEQKY